MMADWRELEAFTFAMLQRLVEKEADPKKMGKSWQSMIMPNAISQDG